MKVLKQTDSTVIIRWLDAKTIEVTFAGKLSNASIDFLVKQFWVEADDRIPWYALFDCSQVTSFTASIRSSSLRFLADFKLKGGREVLAIVTMAPLRMFGQALTFGSGTPLKLFATRDEALTYIIKKLRDD